MTSTWRSDYDVIHQFVRSGLGIALVPALSHVPGGGLVAGRLRDVAVRRHVSVLHRSPGTNPATGAMVTTLREIAASLAHGSQGRVAAEG